MADNGQGRSDANRSGFAGQGNDRRRDGAGKAVHAAEELYGKKRGSGGRKGGEEGDYWQWRL
jgi:hypothetical protein